MKKRTIYRYIPLLLTIVVLFGACDLEEANINKNDPTEVPVNVLLPFNEEQIADMTVSPLQVMSGIFMQYYEGIDNHPHPVQSYIVNEALYVDWEWNNYYNGPMENIYQMLLKAEEDSAYYYTGIGKTLMALCLGNVTSLWGDIPYSEALLGSENLSPKYDSQQSIYESIQQLLDEAIVEFNKTYSGKKPAEDDVIYNGDINKWLMTAYALKARYYMHLTKRASDLPYDPAQKALEAIAGGFVDSNDDLEYQYGFSASEDNPFYSYSLTNYIIPNPYFVGLLDDLNDPRKEQLFAVIFGQINILDGYFTRNTSPVHMMTYHELKFIEAEARLRISATDPEAQNALNEAIRANMTKVSEGSISETEIDDYIAANATLTGNFETDLQTIIVQKYIALYTSIESWTDFRRTGYPELTPNSGGDHNQNPGGAIPRRLPYCQTERLYNTNIPNPLPTLQDRFWWDIE